MAKLVRARGDADVVHASQCNRRLTRTMCHLVTVLGSRALGCEGESSLGRRQTAARCAAVCLLPRSDLQRETTLDIVDFDDAMR